MEKKIKVIYIAGETRSGSTILSNILGSIEKFFNGGEIIEFWGRALEWPCSCGFPVAQCEIWSKIRIDLLPDHNSIYLKKINGMITEAAKSKNVFKLAIFAVLTEKFEREVNESLSAIRDLYYEIQSKTQCNVIVDASKNIGYANMLRLIPQIDLYIIHLVRDARATAYSWKRRKGILWTQKTSNTSLRWLVRNISAELLGRKLKNKYLRIYYEDFVQNPIVYIKNIMKLVKEAPKALPFVADKDVLLKTNHGICGNPDRFKGNIVNIKLDDKWEKGLTKKDKLLVATLTMPLLLKYRYQIIL